MNRIGLNAFRLMQLHGKHERDREFIGISLKLSDIFARTGRLDHAETGYRHCVTKQVQVRVLHLPSGIAIARYCRLSKRR